MTVVELTVMLEPKLTDVTPVMKFVPVSTTSSVCGRLPLVGDILVSVGTGLPTVKAFGNVAVPPPGEALVTPTSRKPVAASDAIVMLTVT